MQRRLRNSIIQIIIKKMSLGVNFVFGYLMNKFIKCKACSFVASKRLFIQGFINWLYLIVAIE